MRIAVKSTLVLIGVYLIIVAAAGFWANRELRSTVSNLMGETAQLLGKEIEAVLHGPIMEQLLRGDSESLARLNDIVETASDRSATLNAIEVINADGKVIASDKDDLRNAQLIPARDVFEEDQAPRLISTFDEFFSTGRHLLQNPLIKNGQVVGYLQMSIINQPIADLYYKTITLMLMMALIGLCIVIGLGLIFQHQLVRLNTGLTSLLENAILEPGHPTIDDKDEFAGVRIAANRMGMKLRDAKGRFEGARRDLDMLTRAINIGVILLQADGCPDFVNEVTKILLVGEHLDRFDDALQDICNKIEGTVKHMQENNITVDSTDLDIDNDSVPRRLHLDLYALDNQQWKGCLVLIKDRDLIDALETDLRAAARFRSLSRLYMGAAHDLRAPLNAMVMNLELLKQTFGANSDKDGEILGQQERYAGVLTEEIARLNRYLNALLEQTAPARDDRRVIDCKELIQSLELLLNPQARHQRIRLDVQLPDKPIVIFGSPGHIKQALLNILINAMEAMSQGGKLSIKLRSADNMAHIEISDTGPGIPSALVSKIFDMHFTTRDTGTGIGLYVTRAIIERNYGTIKVETELGEGTRFDIALPLHNDKEP